MGCGVATPNIASYRNSQALGPPARISPLASPLHRPPDALAPSAHLLYTGAAVTAPQKTFWVADLDPTGEVRLQQEYEYRYLEQIGPAIELIAAFSGDLWRSPAELETYLPGGRLALRWRETSLTGGIATLRADHSLLSLSLLASGLDAAADHATLSAFQQHILRELHDTGVEPAFDLMALKRRPLVASVNFRAPDHPDDRALAALAERCFAASYFRRLGLA
jgi:hypothetical protein